LTPHPDPLPPGEGEEWRRRRQSKIPADLMSETFDTPAAAAPVAPRALGAWETIREALRGSRQDYTDGPIGRAIVLLAIPMVLEMVLESVFAVVDVFWVSRLGADAIATVRLTESMLALIYSLAMGLSMGAAA